MVNRLEPNFEDLTPIEIQKIIGGKKYVLREGSGGAVTAYRNACLAASRMDQDGVTTRIDGLADAEPLLVSLCLFQVVGVKPYKEIPVALETVQGWPYRVQKWAFDKIKEITEGLDDKDTIETLEKRLEEIQRKLDKLRGEEAATKNGQHVEDPLKNELQPTTAISSSAES